MGNWMTVNIKGVCGEEDLTALKKALDPGKSYENFHCLVNGGLCGLPNWALNNINVIGNLAERGYGFDDIAEQLEKLHKIAPSLKVDVHCGGDYESQDCVKTIRLLEDGKTEIVDPLQEKIGDITKEQMDGNLMKQITR